MSDRKGVGAIGWIALLLLTLVFAALVYFRFSSNGFRIEPSVYSGFSEAEISTDEGVEYIRALEALSPEEVEKEIEDIRIAEQEELRRQQLAEMEAMRQKQLEELQALRQQRYEDMSTGVIDVWSLFQDYVMIGDSRVLGFSYYGFLPESRVFAELGATILGVGDKLYSMHQLNPAYIYLSFGANDMVSYLWPTGPEYAARYKEMVEMLQSEFPNAVIVVNSIPAITEPALSSESIYSKVGEFNDSLRQMCAETGCVFVDNDAVSAAHSDLYGGDGIHFSSSFYPYWGATMIEAVLEYEEGEPTA